MRLWGVLTRNDLLALAAGVALYSTVYIVLAARGTFLPGWAAWVYSAVLSWSILAHRGLRTLKELREQPAGAVAVLSARARKRRERKQRHKGG